jgi:diacylglycerol O-acyltransferase
MASMERLSALDASFLRVESTSAHMHVGWLATLELPPGRETLDVAAVIARLESRLHLVPRFRQVIGRPPGGLGGPAWIDADDFALEDHVTADGPERMAGSALLRQVDRFFSEQLPRDRPLWRLHVVPRLQGRRAAVMGKVHHAMVDGIAAVQLGLLLFDGTPDPGESAANLPEPWAPRATSPVRMAVDAARDTALDQFRTARRTMELGLNPGRGMRMADSMRRAAFGLAEDVRRPAPSSYLNAPIGPQRRLVGAKLSMPRALAIRERTGTKLNDVVLATVAGALARLAVAHGELPRDLRVMVPVNVRDGEPGSQGNRISFMFVDLPIEARSAVERLRLVHERTCALKAEGRVAGTDQVMRLLELLPGPVQGQAARFAASPRMYNLTVSNVPGPPIPLYIAGARVGSILPVIPIPDRHALAIGALSYQQRLHVSAYLDPEALPRGGRLPLMFAEAFEELDVATAPAPAR